MHYQTAFIDPYLDPSSGVLANTLGITNANQLGRVEADYSTLGLTSLLYSEYSLNYSPQGLSSIHRELFGALFPWAGSFRQVEIRKGSQENSPIFLPSANITNALNILFLILMTMIVLLV